MDMKYIKVNERTNYSQLYHFTSMISLVLIIDEDVLGSTELEWEEKRRNFKVPSKYKYYISFTRDKNFDTFKYLYSSGHAGIIVDGEKLSDKYKFVPYNHFHDEGHRDESEETLLLKDDGMMGLKGINKYIKELIVPSFENFYKEFMDYYYNGNEDSSIYLVEKVNKVLKTDYDAEDIGDSEDRETLKLLYNDLLRYIENSPFKYNIN